MRIRVNFLANMVFVTLLLFCVNASAAKGDVVKGGVEKFGSWFYQCNTAKAGKICLLRHIQRFKNKNPALTLTIFDSTSADKMYMHFKVPLGVYLQDGVRISVDSSKPRIAKYLDCNKSGCVGTIGFNVDEVRALKVGKKMQVQFTHQRGKKKIRLNVPLDGTQAGIAKVWKPGKVKQKKAVQQKTESGGATNWFSDLFSGESDSSKSQ